MIKYEIEQHEFGNAWNRWRCSTYHIEGSFVYFKDLYEKEHTISGTIIITKVEDKDD